MVKRAGYLLLFVTISVIVVGCGDATATSISTTNTASATPQPTDNAPSLTDLADHLTKTHDALAKGDVAAAKAAYLAFNDGWYEAENDVQSASLDLYKKTENAMAPIGFKLLHDTNPVAADILPLVASLQTVFTQDIAAAKASPSKTVSPNQAISGADVDAAVAKIRTYMLNGVTTLVTSRTAFATSVKSHDVSAAKAAYIAVRPSYEGIEFLAEAFPDADSAIDARPDDFPQGEKDPGWTGFHRLEKAIFVDQKLDSQTDTLADQLIKDVAALQASIQKMTIDPDVAINGAASLIEEIQATKITGEEERYSHTDLSDFKANLVSAQFIYDTFAPFVQQRNATLAGDITAQFATVSQAIAPLFDAQGKAVDYSTVNDATRKTLAQRVEALANSYSQVAGTLGLKG